MAQLREQEALEQAKQAAADAAERAEVARLMETLSPAQLLHIIGEIQRLSVSAPEVARALVGENIQLALAIQHAVFLVGLLEEPSLHTDAEVKERAKSVREKIWQSGAPPLPPQPLAPKAAVPAMTVPTQMALALSPVPSPCGVAPQSFVAGPLFGHTLGTPVPLAPRTVGVAPVIRGVAPAPAATVRPLQAAMTTGPMVVPASNDPRLAAAVNPPAVGGAEEAQRRGFLERLVQLSPAQIDQLPHDQKVQLLEFLQTLPPAP